MAYGVFLIAVFSMLTGLVSVATLNSKATIPSSTALQSSANADVFVSYRNALTQYVTANKSFTGQITTSVIQSSLAPGQSIPTGFSNIVVATASGNGRIVYTWASLPQGAIYDVVKVLQGDPSVGVVSGTQWISPAYGVLGTPPAYVPDQAVLSAVQIGF